MKAMVLGVACLLLCRASGTMEGANDAAWLDRLAGKWEGNVGGGRYVEEWRKVDAGTYEGVSTTWSGDKQVASERLRITAFADHWIYLANPGGQGVSSFMRVSSDPDTWIFENKEHDFPKRIGYRLTGNGALIAWIAGATDDAGRMEFQLKRVK